MYSDDEVRLCMNFKNTLLTISSIQLRLDEMISFMLHTYLYHIYSISYCIFDQGSADDSLKEDLSL